MSIWQRIAREPNAILGVLVGVYGVLVAFDILTLTAPQVGAVTALGGAAVVALRWLVTPSGEVIVQRPPGGDGPVAGPASSIPTGEPVAVMVTRSNPQGGTTSSETGAIDLGTAVLIAVLVTLLLVVLGLLPLR